ncbi:MAG: YihY/virulence factor BrkB family protein [Verrucomicrobia bacterium]|nr:YihY/virulence factor BrkB family protein [Verrucomicrobiota bacterium]
MSWLASKWHHAAHLCRVRIWEPAAMQDRSLRGRAYAVLRVCSITFTAFNETNAASRAAALSFSSLLGLGPVIALVVLVAGFAMGGQNDPNRVAHTLNQIIKFVAPQVNQYEAIPDPSLHHVPGEVALNPKLVDLLNDIIAGAQSGSAGLFGVLSLILIVLLLFKSIEDAFNDIWGVRTGRSWLMRVAFYWTILTLGAVLFFAAITLLGAGTFINVFMERLPFGVELLKVLSWSLPLFSVTLLVSLLTLFYRLIPNTRVFWGSALAGAVVVAGLMLLNNYLAFLYLRRVYLTKSLYGSLGVLPVLMLGLYIFWLYVLIGGVISYAVQNVHFRNSQAAWTRLSEAMRERLSLVVLLTVCRRFQSCLPPVSASHLGTLIKVPTQILNASLNRLVDLGLITPLPPPPGTPDAEACYQPARPLSRIYLLDFKTLNENYGEDPVGDTLQQIDPILLRYKTAFACLGEQELFQKSLEQLITEFDFDVSRPPFALGESTRPAAQ